MKKSTPWLAAAAVLVSIPALRAFRSVEARVAADAVTLTAGELDWQPTQREGVEAALLWGDREAGSYGQMMKIPAGFNFPAHDHETVERLVVIQGTYWVGLGEASMKALGPGSYALLPPGAEHRSRCGEESPCLLFSERAPQ
jgi:quercetin dioxygenase-like cupin family protein